ncbi:hypothetical protein [uncultured Thiodictyon sp.]|uniref:hypothetical protein n=1 Tax=uncultured Thiodictyon sp. TaxID=1846217 RepID=UPI0025F25619|nr:hypothetical protein [uncultured Thiodictyon sp.]
MAWTSIEHSCGHTERHQLYGPGRTRDWRAQCLVADPCEDCARAAREAENAAAAAANAEAGLPPMTGTEKQIAWAETIRAYKLDLLGRALTGDLTGIDLAAFWGGLDRRDPRAPAMVDALQAQTLASWWIDHRDRKVGDLLLALAAELPKEPAAPADAPAAAVLAEATLRPATEQTATIADICLDGDRISVVFPEKREDFRNVVKAKGYRWEAARLSWTRTIDARSGPLADRAAEIGNALLAGGFCVRIQDHAIRAAAQSASFAPERQRWVLARTSGTYAGWLVISWPREEDLYSAAKALPGARYDKPAVVVPAAQYAAIEDFAEAYDLAISPAAQVVLDTARLTHEQALLAVPAKAPRPGKGPGPMPPAPGAIDPGLLDDDSGSEYAMLHGDSAS